ncbi:hypothetical protein ACFVJ5_22340 [Nocardia sp. NPDC127606]|uniref:hypothetical protein n=1 Tax=Nocardia sp. NPDC127606 TaxID=3345406 RepID=UPI00364272B4
MTSYRNIFFDVIVHAQDIEWSTGAGTPVHGPILGLLLLMTGRSVAVTNLRGPGLAALPHRLR